MGEQTDPDGAAATSLRSRDHAAFNVLYLRHRRGVHRYLMAALRDEDTAEDVGQEAFMKAFRFGSQYEARGERFEAWLFTIVRNCALDHVARNRRVTVEDPADLDRRRDAVVPVADAASELRWGELASVIERLPESQRQVLGLRYLYGLSTAEIGVVLGRSGDAVRQLETRALRFLRPRVQPGMLA
jgi:RNA polymerase sigma-70 factor, ECF subfamily